MSDGVIGVHCKPVMTTLGASSIGFESSNDDQGLLDRYTQSNDSAAFTGLVQKYIHFVHGVATRSLGGDASLADDVTQSVFIIFAKKASRIRSAGMIGSWLHQTTLYACANARKQKSRRSHYEQLAASREGEADMSETEQLQPLLDEAIATLNQTDRAAIISRYLQGNSAEQIAQHLNSTPVAIQKRLERALNKLRSFFDKKCLSVTPTAISTALLSSGNHLAPQSLVQLISTTSLTTIATSASVTGITKGTLLMLKMIQFKLIALITICTIAIGTLGIAIAEQTVGSAAPTTQSSNSIQGKWDVVDSIKEGALQDGQFTEGIVTIDDKQIQIGKSKADAVLYKLDDSTNPKQIECTVIENKKIIHGIYELSGDSLKICFNKSGGDRPTGFDAQLGNPNFTFLDLKRHVDDDTKTILGQWTSPGGYIDRSDGKALADDKHFELSIDISDTIIKETIGKPIVSVITMQYRLDPATNPKQVLVFDPKINTWKQIGTYQIDEDNLKIALDLGPAPVVEQADHSTPNRWNLKRVKPESADLKKINGDWRFVAAYQNGKPAPADQISATLLTFTDQIMQITVNGKIKDTSTYDIDPATGQFNLHDTANPDRLVPGIYDLNGDQLRINFDDRNAIRPKAFSDDPTKSSGKLYILKRDTPPVMDNAQIAVATMSNLRSLTQVIIIYANTHQNMLPPDLQALVASRNLSLKVLRSPTSTDHESYIYLGNADVNIANLGAEFARTVIVYDKTPLEDGSIAAAFGDGHVEVVTKADFDALLQKSKTIFAKFQPPAK